MHLNSHIIVLPSPSPAMIIKLSKDGLKMWRVTTSYCAPSLLYLLLISLPFFFSLITMCLVTIILNEGQDDFCVHVRKRLGQLEKSHISSKWNIGTFNMPFKNNFNDVNIPSIESCAVNEDIWNLKLEELQVFGRQIVRNSGSFWGKITNEIALPCSSPKTGRPFLDANLELFGDGDAIPHTRDLKDGETIDVFKSHDKYMKRPSKD